MKIIDVEIKRAILGKNELAMPGIEYCNGWGDYLGMGISVACVFDTTTKLSRAFLMQNDEDKAEFQEYIDDTWTCGFNTKGFDIPLLTAHGFNLNPAKHYDLYHEITKQTGKFVKGWKLDPICEATFGMKKSGAGAMAPVWWQQGKQGKVIDYCLRDVWLEAQVYLHVLEGKSLSSIHSTQSVNLSNVPE